MYVCIVGDDITNNSRTYMQPHKTKQRRQTDGQSAEVYQINWQATRENPSENDWRQVNLRLAKGERLGLIVVGNDWNSIETDTSLSRFCNMALRLQHIIAFKLPSFLFF